MPLPSSAVRAARLLAPLALLAPAALAQEEPIGVFTNPGKTLHIALREKILGHDDPKIEDEYFLVSPDGRSLAYMLMGSGALSIVHDGIEGEPFKGIAPETIQFSPDSKRLVYVGSRDRKTFVVVDGELFESKALHESGVSFSPDSAHIAWVAVNEQGDRYAVIDGVEGEHYSSIGERGVVFSPDGAHYAFVADRDGYQTLVRDGVEGPFFERVLDFWWSPSGEHLGYVVDSNGSKVVLMDEDPVAEGDTIGRDGLVFARNSDHWAIAVRKGKSWHLVTGERVLGPYKNILPGLTFNDDGSHLAFLAGHGKGMVLVLDGQETQDWPGYQTLRFGGEHTAMVVIDDAVKRHVVLDGEVGPAWDSIDPRGVVFDRSGKHWYYIAQDGDRITVVSDGENGPSSKHLGSVPPSFLSDGRLIYSLREKKQETLVVDGKPVGVYPRLRHFVLSPDRTRYACFTGKDGEWTLLLDGEPRGTYPFAPSPPVFTQDSKRMAFLAGRSRKNFVVVDGIEGPAFDIIQRRSVAFTPDGKHVAYLAGTADKRYIVVDDVLVENDYTGFHSGSGVLCLDDRHIAVRAARGGTWILAELELL
ncbi:MAG TPA: hypothetical protein ENJ09_14725 [Planctomycetes bacterium]|nr:hypothetical protein [Planctomycetota bacterium]